ncbi:hypothetical protein [Actinomyces minihominis]|uniref:hypothetical protein n=1 Tax=Actinomyces minihominis TaxID=2002838 RepID=UPI00101ADA2C|nr:hypothetical protein [Actinomyces minihominis]
MAWNTHTPVAVSHRSTCAIIGTAVDPRFPEHGEELIVESLSSSSTDEAQAILDRLIGRYAVVFESQEEGVRVQQDALGLRAVYYSDQQYNPVVGSHMVLVAGQVHAPVNQFGAPGYLAEANETTYPGRSTGRLGVLRLTPNCELLGESQKIKRVFPRTQRVEISAVEAAAFTKNRVSQLLKALQARRVRLLVSVTGGLDSRVTTSLIEERASATYFTYEVLFRPKNRADKHDVGTATEIAQRLGLDYRVIKLESREVDPSLERDMVGNWPLQHSRALAQAYRSELPPGVHIRSNGFEVGSSYWRRHGFGDNELNAREMRRIASSKRGKSHASLDSFSEYINASAFTRVEELGYDPYDFFYWEIRMGSWLATALHESDIAHETVILINSREILDTLLSVPYADRVEDAVSKILLEQGDVELTEIPVNGVPYTMYAASRGAS